MKKKSKEVEEDPDMLPEYDFSKGVRGKYAKNAGALEDGFTVNINKEDNTVETRHYIMHKNAVILDPDVKAYFPDSKAVNDTLRTLIGLIPKANKTPTRTARNKRAAAGKEV